MFTPIFAEEVLKLSPDMALELTTSKACGRTMSGTPEHAQAGADHIERFRQTHRQHLLNVKITPKATR